MTLTMERPTKARSLKKRRAPDRAVAIDDGYVADGYVADEFVADEFVADEFVADEFVAEQDKYPIRELPACIRNRRPGQELTNAECIEAMQWMKDVLHDAANAARARAKARSNAR